MSNPHAPAPGVQRPKAPAVKKLVRSQQSTHPKQGVNMPAITKKHPATKAAPKRATPAKAPARSKAPAAKKTTATTKSAASTTPRRRKPTTAVASTHPLAHLIPSMKWYDAYYSRDIGGIADLDWFNYGYMNQKSVLTFGPTGPGKTACARAFCAVMKIPFVRIMCNGGFDPSTLWITPVQNEQGRWEKQKTEVLECIIHGGMVYMDEVAFMPQRNASTFYSAMDEGREVTIAELGNARFEVNRNTLFAGSYNPPELGGYEGTRPLNRAFRNRFSIKLKFDYERTIESELCSSTALLDLADKLRLLGDAGTISAPTPTNTLMDFEQIAVGLGMPAAMVNFLNNYDAADMAAVKNNLDLAAPSIAADLGIDMGNNASEEDEDIEDEDEEI